MSKVIHLQTAIQKALENDPTLSGVVSHGQTDTRTGQPRLAIVERGSNTAKVFPSINFDVIDTEPITKDQPTLGYYDSLVFIYATDPSQPRAKHIADLIHGFLTDIPDGEDPEWFRDFSDECIQNTYTKFISRLRFGREGQNYFDDETDLFYEAVELRIFWRDRGCEGNCEDYVDETAELVVSDLEECDC